MERGNSATMGIEQANSADAQDILKLQRLAYQSEAELYHDDTIPPLTQTLEALHVDIETQIVLKATIDGTIIGSVRAYMQEHTCLIGRLIVHPNAQGRGIGSRLLCKIEQHFTHACRYELFTGHKSIRNIRLYQRLGYTICRNQPVNDRLTLVFLEKRAVVRI
jgi:ribosomal protein S18 acetylase RimI-like enzyme